MTKIEKRRNRRKAKSVRAIKAYWLKEAKTAHTTLVMWDEEWQELNNYNASEYDEYLEALGYNCSTEELIQDAAKYADKAYRAMKNALTRYSQAIPK